MSTSDLFDVLVIGSGAAGLGLALSLAKNYRVAVICKDDLFTSSSQRAQGGIAAVMDQEDSLDSHIQDTLVVGAGLSDPTVVEFTITKAKSAIEWLIKQGVQFTTQTEGQNFHLTREGGHSHRRVVHAADSTGATVVKTLSEQVAEHHNIQSMTNHTAIDLIVENNQVYGAYVYDNINNQIKIIRAKYTVIATGGLSGTYLHTSNPGHATGDGISIAFKAGARLANMEFNQFHPTCFYDPNGQTFLITEAMRGEGAKLLLPNGESFMQNYDPRGELAPRDVVSRAIDNELKTKNLRHVYLDISHEPAEKIKRLFPTMYQFCLNHGIDITKSPIPVVPAAHYTCGGIVTNLQGKTDVKNLYAVGEVACTGLHGANRMASNSLLECLVFAKSAAQSIQKELSHYKNKQPSLTLLEFDLSRSDMDKEITQITLELRTLIWDYVGIVRSNERLAIALQKLEEIEVRYSKIHAQAKISKSFIEFGNLLAAAKLICYCAISRHESRGVHYNKDYPKMLEKAQNTVVVPDGKGSFHIEHTNDIHSLVENL